MVLTSLASTIRTSFRKTTSLSALMCPQPFPLKRVRQLDHLLHLQVSTLCCCLISPWKDNCCQVVVPFSVMSGCINSMCYNMLVRASSVFLQYNLFILCVHFFLVCTDTCIRLSVHLSVCAFSGKRSSISRTESSDSFQRRGHFLPQPPGEFSSSSLPAKDPLADPFAPSSPPRHNVREADRFASFDKVSTSLSPSPSPSLDSQ